MPRQGGLYRLWGVWEKQAQTTPQMQRKSYMMGTVYEVEQNQRQSEEANRNLSNDVREHE
jgi:hypothetical protein